MKREPAGRVDPGPEGEYEPSLEGPGAVPREQYCAGLFSNRPRRMNPCIHCGGSGSVTRGYALAHDGSPDHLDDARIWATVVGSSSIHEATREAAEIATSSGTVVAFEFLDHLVEVRPGDDPDVVARAWWFKQYGQSPEQSLADR
jgi:hypothetical protein